MEPNMTIIELVQFKLQPGTSDANFLAAAEEAQTGFLEGFEGFIKRELWKDEAGQWVDLIYWTTNEAAQNSIQQFVSHPSTQHFMALIQPDSMTAFHYTQVKSFS